MFDKLPLSIKIKNEEYTIVTDFRYYIKFEEIIKRGADKQEILNFMFSVCPFFDKIIELNLVEEFISEFLKFYNLGDTIEDSIENKGTKQEDIFDYYQDRNYIWGAFYTQYRVDLNEDSLHWWKFKAMWNCLDSELIFSKIRSYRVYNGKDKNLLELKQFYKLKESKENKERKKKIIEEILSKEKRC